MLIVTAGAAALGFLAFRMNDHLKTVENVAKEGLGSGVDDRYAKNKVMQLEFFVMGCVLWPMAAVLILRQEWDSGTLVYHPLLWAVSVWVLLLLLVDILLVSSTPAGSLDSVKDQQREVKNTFLSVVGSVFAFGMLLSAITSKPGGRSKRAAQIGITGLLIGLAFAIPVLETDRDSMLSYALTSVMKIACLIAVGIFMAGIVVELVPNGETTEAGVESPAVQMMALAGQPPANASTAAAPANTAPVAQP